MTKLSCAKTTSSLFMLVCTTSLAQQADAEYIESVDPQLYQKLLLIENCRKQKISAQLCKQQLNDKAAAETTQITPTTKTEPETPKNWWLRSAYDPSAPVASWHNAVESDLTLNRLNGNIDGSQYSFNLTFFNRYSAWTNSLALGYSNDKLRQSDQLVYDRDYRLFNYGGRYDLDQTWFGQLGFIREQDSNLSTQYKQVVYGGAGAYLSNTEKYKLYLVTAFGQQHDRLSSYSNEITGLSELNYQVGYVYQEFNWTVSENLRLSLSAGALFSLDDLPEFSPVSDGNCKEQLTSDALYCIDDYSNATEYKFNLGLDYSLNQWISLIYRFDYTHNTLPFLEDKSTDSTQTLGIKASFQ